MKTVKITLAGRERHLAFTGGAMFDLQEKYEGISELMDAVGTETREGFLAACDVAATLANHGELARRHYGYDSEPMLTAEAVADTTTPEEIVALKLAIPAAISLGYGREVKDDNEEIDIVLLELNQKKTM